MPATPAGIADAKLRWLLPTHITLSDFIGGIILMLFIYWGWDTAVSVNEETKDKNKTPGRAAIISTVLLLVTYVIVIVSMQAFAGVGSKGVGLTNPAHQFDVLSVTGGAIFGTSGFGTFLSRLLILMVLSSAAASTQTTILPTARTTLSMAAYKALPASFAKIHPKNLTPTVSTLTMGAISIALYIPLNYLSGGNPIADAVTAIGLYIAFYYGLTGFACVWYYRRTLTSSARNLWMRGILPGLGGLLMYAGGASTRCRATGWPPTATPSGPSPGCTGRSAGSSSSPSWPRLAGVLGFVYMRVTAPAFFRKETLTRGTPTLVPDPDA